MIIIIPMFYVRNLPPQPSCPPGLEVVPGFEMSLEQHSSYLAQVVPGEAPGARSPAP